MLAVWPPELPADHPTTHPGGYLPHAWVEHDHRKLSTIDLRGMLTVDDGGNVLVVQDPLLRCPHLSRGGLAAACGVGSGAVRARSNRCSRFDVVELQRAGDRVEHTLRCSVDVAALKPGVVVGADTGQHGDLGAPQSPALAAGHRCREVRPARASRSPGARSETPAPRLCCSSPSTVSASPARWEALPYPPPGGVACLEGEQHLGGATLVHRLIAFGGFVERER
jgi:hypothetical protein